VDDNNGSTDPGFNNNPVGPGGGGGGPGSAPGSVAPQANRTFRADISIAQWAALEARIKDMLKNNNCMGRQLYNGLNASMSSNQKINFIPQSGRGGAYSYGSNTMWVGDNTTGNASGNLFHESFHAFQRLGNQPFPSNTVYNANTANREVEAWLAHYYYTQNNASTESHWVDIFDNPNNPLGSALRNLSNYISISGQLTGNANLARDAIENVRLQLAHQGYLSINHVINNPQNIGATFSNMSRLFDIC
jgi:hypothetical protein